jgi:hypothetical protein
MMWTEDTIAGAILGCVASFFVQERLETLTAGISSPLLAVVLHWWPLAFIAIGLMVLLRRSVVGKQNGSRELEGGR